MILPPFPLRHFPNMSSSAAISAPHSFSRSSTQDVLVAIVNLSPVEYDHVQHRLRDNYPLACAIDVARQSQLSLRLCEKVTKTLSLAKEDLQETQHRLKNSLDMIVDILSQAPLGSQIPGEFYDRWGRLLGTEPRPADQEPDVPPNSPTTSLQPSPWRRRSPRQSVQAATAASEANSSRPSSVRSRRSSRSSNKSSLPRPTLVERLASPVTSYPLEYPEYESPSPPPLIDNYLDSMEATFGLDEDGEVICA